MTDDKTRAEFEESAKHEFAFIMIEFVDGRYFAKEPYFLGSDGIAAKANEAFYWWQAAKERYGRDEDAALDLLCVMFNGYENGVDCYEDPEDQSGYVGSAFRLNDEDFHKIADLLNRRRPVSQPAAKEQKHG